MSGADAFFDTNVLLYLLSEDATKAEKTERLVAVGGTISVQVLNEFASVARRKLGMTIAEVREVLATIRAVCRVRPVDLAAHDLALDLAERYHFSIYDSLILAAAMRASCAILYSEDLQHGKEIGGMIIQNPFVPD